MATNAELQGQVDTLTKERDRLATKVQKLTVERDGAEARLADEKKAKDEAVAALEVAQGENAKIAASLKAYKGSATKARAEALVLKRELSPEPRKLGASRPARDAEELMDREAALLNAFAEGTVELAFSDGKREITELAPLLAETAAFRRDARGMTLDFEPIVEMERGVSPVVTIKGVALVNDAGEQAGWCPLHEPIVVPRGARMQIPRGTIRF